MEREVKTLTAIEMKSTIATAVLRKEVDILYKQLDELKADVKDIKETLSQATGGWKLLLIIAGVSGILGAVISKLGLLAQFGVK